MTTVQPMLTVALGRGLTAPLVSDVAASHHETCDSETSTGPAADRMLGSQIAHPGEAENQASGRGMWVRGWHSWAQQGVLLL